MKEKLVAYIKKNHLFGSAEKLILTISAGADSVALAHLFKELNYDFILAHCNFNLRGNESDEDEVFVKNLAEKFGVKCFLKQFETKDFADKNKLSIQMAARDLRYKWFEELRVKLNYDFIVTAHHRDDDIETFFINILRGTGIKGMLGIQPKKEKIIRPLLPFSKQEIYDFLQTNKLDFREDSSNNDVKYLRNKIRLQLLPLLQEMNPSIAETISKEMEYLSGVSAIYFAEIKRQKNKILNKKMDALSISIEELNKLKSPQTYLYEFLKPFGFSNVEDIFLVIARQSGKQFYSTTHRIIVDRNELIIQPIFEEKMEEYFIEEKKTEIVLPIHLSLNISENLAIQKDKNIAMLDYDKLQFPLKLRKWNKGDFFYPLGMKCKKKLSDFFVDNKISIPEKEQVWVLCSGQEIVWIVGRRIDERFKISENSKKTYIAQLL